MCLCYLVLREKQESILNSFLFVTAFGKLHILHCCWSFLNKQNRWKIQRQTSKSSHQLSEADTKEQHCVSSGLIHYFLWHEGQTICATLGSEHCSCHTESLKKCKIIVGGCDCRFQNWHFQRATPWTGTFCLFIIDGGMLRRREGVRGWGGVLYVQLLNEQ